MIKYKERTISILEETIEQVVSTISAVSEFDKLPDNLARSELLTKTVDDLITQVKKLNDLSSEYFEKEIKR